MTPRPLLRDYNVITMDRMKTRLVKIGNSHGVRIPKPLIDQIGLGGEIDLLVRKDALVLRARRRPRAGWAAAFAAMHRAGHDRLLDETTASRWDDEEWEW